MWRLDTQNKRPLDSQIGAHFYDQRSWKDQRVSRWASTLAFLGLETFFFPKMPNFPGKASSEQ